MADQRIGLNTTGFSNTDNLRLSVGMGVSHAVTGVLIGNGTTSEFTGHIRGIITGINTSSDGTVSIDVKVISRVSSAGTVTDVDYAKSDKTRSFQGSKHCSSTTPQVLVLDYTINSGTVVDWYDQQQLH